MQVTAYRGQYGLPIPVIHTRRPSISFGSLKAAKLYAIEPNDRDGIVVKPIVLRADITINNPVIYNLDDCFAELGPLAEKLGADFMWEVALRLEDGIYSTGNWQDNYSEEYGILYDLYKDNSEALDDLYIDAYLLLDDAEFVKRAASLGYDGAVHMGNGETCDEIEYRVFGLEQIRNMRVVEI